MQQWYKLAYDPNGGSKAIGETERVDAASLKNS